MPKPTRLAGNDSAQSTTRCVLLPASPHPERRGRLAPRRGKPWPHLPPVQIGCAQKYLLWGHPRSPISRAVQAAQLARLVPTWNRHMAKICVQSQETENRSSAASKRGLQSSGGCWIHNRDLPNADYPNYPFISNGFYYPSCFGSCFFWFHLKEIFTSPKNKLYLQHKKESGRLCYADTLSKRKEEKNGWSNKTRSHMMGVDHRFGLKPMKFPNLWFPLLRINFVRSQPASPRRWGPQGTNPQQLGISEIPGTVGFPIK